MRKFRFSFQFVVLLLCLIGIAAWLLIFRNNSLLSAAEPGGSPHTPSTGPPASHVDMTQDDPMAAFIKAFNTPIELHGKVVDQHGDPVAGATVKLSPVDRPFGDQSNSHVTVNLKPGSRNLSSNDWDPTRVSE